LHHIFAKKAICNKANSPFLLLMRSNIKYGEKVVLVNVLQQTPHDVTASQPLKAPSQFTNVIAEACERCLVGARWSVALVKLDRIDENNIFKNDK